jgi:hypothetical protein
VHKKTVVHVRSVFSLCPFAMSDQRALETLKEAKDIEFYYSESDMTPLPSVTAVLQQNAGGANTGKFNTLLSS